MQVSRHGRLIRTSEIIPKILGRRALCANEDQDAAAKDPSRGTGKFTTGVASDAGGRKGVTGWMTHPPGDVPAGQM
jgi:hypothetical protein